MSLAEEVGLRSKDYLVKVLNNMHVECVDHRFVKLGFRQEENIEDPFQDRATA